MVEEKNWNQGIIPQSNEHDRRDPGASAWGIPHSVVNSQIVVAAQTSCKATWCPMFCRTFGSSRVSDPQFVNETLLFYLFLGKRTYSASVAQPGGARVS